ncbi:MAG TPA: hypothetical protein DCE41_28195 [Cytophagales bacterium]|nr:hypothetical protein [Cytophagales bacterium]HAA18855.1 hypothetical protein [Cytophagales bacterium]HAP62770.1 hypothetical protein [Cytophagales bacterium]
MRILAYVFAAIMLASAVGHFINPEFYSAMIPSWAPEGLTNIAVGLGEFAVAVALILPKYRKLGALGWTILMLIFLPIHIWDLTRDQPAMGSTTAATVRLVIQFVLIYGGYRLYQKS